MKKALTNRTQTLTERMTMEIWVIGILNQLLMGETLMLKLSFRKCKL